MGLTVLSIAVDFNLPLYGICTGIRLYACFALLRANTRDSETNCGFPAVLSLQQRHQLRVVVAAAGRGRAEDHAGVVIGGVGAPLHQLVVVGIAAAGEVDPGEEHLILGNPGLIAVPD